MFDLSAKEKPRSPFGKLKDKMKGRHKYELESASAVVPSSYGALEDEGPGLEGGRKGPRLPKAGFFFKGKLRRSSLTRSNTSLGSDSTLSSAGSLAGSAGNEALAPSPARHGSFSTDRSVRDFLPSPKLTHKRAFSDEASQVALLPESKSVQSLKPSGKEPISRSSLCINGSHIYCEEPPPKPSFLSSPSAPAAPQKPPDEGPRGPDPEMPTWSGVRGQKGPPQGPPQVHPLAAHLGRPGGGQAVGQDHRPEQAAGPGQEGGGPCGRRAGRSRWRPPWSSPRRWSGSGRRRGPPRRSRRRRRRRGRPGPASSAGAAAAKTAGRGPRGSRRKAGTPRPLRVRPARKSGDGAAAPAGGLAGRTPRRGGPAPIPACFPPPQSLLPVSPPDQTPKDPPPQPPPRSGTTASMPSPPAA
nr:PREDICTED: rab11 family-interacting protein 5-like [Anolis carolinensis]|eukprot:XP_008123532.1 PREDICTED: rab11 family-interacting protein 5-like [Anolis carolinensis]